MTRVAVIQSNYLPWRGYFDIIHDVDLFVFHDDLQYTKQDWRNRNKFKTAQGATWLTVPAGTREDRLICEVKLEDTSWQREHWAKIRSWYSKAPHFETYRPFFEDFFLARKWSGLSEMNQYAITHIAKEFLGIRTRFEDSRKYGLREKKLARLLELLKASGASTYVSGPAAKDYIETSTFADAGIELIWKDYSGYPSYPQLFEPFTGEVSILDLLFNAGSVAPHLIWGWRDEASRKNHA